MSPKNPVLPQNNQTDQNCDCDFWAKICQICGNTSRSHLNFGGYLGTNGILEPGGGDRAFCTQKSHAHALKIGPSFGGIPLQPIPCPWDGVAAKEAPTSHSPQGHQSLREHSARAKQWCAQDLCVVGCWGGGAGGITTAALACGAAEERSWPGFGQRHGTSLIFRACPFPLPLNLVAGQ